MTNEQLEFFKEFGMDYLVEFNYLQSSIITAVGYNPTTRTMAILFTSNTIYVYPHMTMKSYETIRDANSPGSVFKAMKIPKYKRIL